MSIWEGTALLTNTILIVEDEPSIAENISYALSTEGFASIRCATGQDAQEVLQRRDIVLVILDIGLPDMNGFELAKTIRRGNDVPLIFVTARADEIDRVVGLEIGADDYVVKPFSPRELTARVKAVLRRTRTPGSGATRTDRSGAWACQGISGSCGAVYGWVTRNRHALAVPSVTPLASRIGLL